MPYKVVSISNRLATAYATLRRKQEALRSPWSHLSNKLSHVLNKTADGNKVRPRQTPSGKSKIIGSR